MAYLQIEINVGSESIGQTNTHVDDTTRAHEGLQKLINLLKHVNSAHKSNVTVTVTTSPTSAGLTAGAGGKAVTYGQIS